jgi:hypothetical protein
VVTNGFSLVSFRGGTSQQLVASANCPSASLAFYSTSGGDFVSYIPASAVGAVNEAWKARFPNDVIPVATPLLVQCRA